IFVRWGLYSVPGWDPLVHPGHDFYSQDYITHNPYAEWYLNSMRLDGSPTQAYHREHYGADYNYYNFAQIFNRETQKWNHDSWAEIFLNARDKYVLLSTKLKARYRPYVLWNDIDYPKSGHPLQIMAEYYNALPDGVIDDRFGVKHSDFKSPEYETLDKISPIKWEECRGLGRSFGYNRAEGEAETIAPDGMIYLLVDIVRKNGT